MKRLIFLTSLFICASGFAQRGWFADSIRVPNGADTTVYLYFWTESPWGLSVEYKDLDSATATLNLGECPIADGSIFNQLDSDDLPYTMADTTQAFEKMRFNFRYLAILLTRNTEVAGPYVRYYITRDDVPYLFPVVRLEPMPGKLEYGIDLARLHALH